jgi:Tfp pilus assembly PilM family ATPase
MARMFVGLDIGHHTVRAVALRREGRAFAVSGFGEVRRRDAEGETRPLAEVIEELKRQVPLGRSPCVAHGDLVTLVKYVGTIPLPPDRLLRLLRLELMQAIESTELAADSFPVPLASDELIHCCVLTQPAHAHDALKGLAAVGITPQAIHVAQAAIYNATVVLPPVQDDELALLVDIGATTTSVTLLGDRRLLACRQLPIGGDSFANALTGSDGLVSASSEQRLRAGDGRAAPLAELKASKSATVRSAPLTSAALTSVVSSEITHQPNEIDFGDLELSDDHSPAVSKPMVQQPNGKIDGDELELIDDHHPHSVTEDGPLVWADELNQKGKPGEDLTGGLQLDVGGTNSHSLPMVTTTRVPFPVSETDQVAAPGRATQQIASRTLGPDLTKVAESLYAQLASSLAWFRTQIHARQLTVTKVLLTGGGAGLEGLDTYLQRRFNLPVTRFDPCDGLTGRAPDCPHEFATAIGLAIAAADSIPGTCRLDLTPDGVLRQQLWRSKLVWPYVAAACLLLSAVFSGWTMLNDQWVAEANIASYTAFEQRHNELQAKLDALSKERDGLSEDLRAIAGRVFAGRDLLYTVRALKEQTKDSPELWITSLETVGIASDVDVTNTKNATARGLLGATPAPNNKTARRDSAIDRGAVDVEGLVKFDNTKTDVEMNKFFETYNVAIAKWQANKDTLGLFRDDKVLVHLVEHNDADKTKSQPGGRTNRRPVVANEPGRFPFKLRFFFQPTKLDQITNNGSVSAAAPKALEPKP